MPATTRVCVIKYFNFFRYFSPPVQRQRLYKEGRKDLRQVKDVVSVVEIPRLGLHPPLLPNDIRCGFSVNPILNADLGSVRPEKIVGKETLRHHREETKMFAGNDDDVR